MWTIDNIPLKSRLWLGSALYPSLSMMESAIHTSQASVVTVSIRRQKSKEHGDAFWSAIKRLPCRVLPNTAGCRTAVEAILMAEMAREIFETPWIKLEVIGDDYTLQPNPFELVTAAKQLVDKGFSVFPYCTDDLVLCQRLVDVGCVALMPWGAPIGSGRGLLNVYALQTLRHRFKAIPLIVDAGIGKPSDATRAMEMGFDGVLLNSAVALATKPVDMAQAFAHAVSAGHLGYQAGIMPERNVAYPSTPLLDRPFWHQVAQV